MSEDVQVDGRKARGEKRRTQIIEATLAVIERDGTAGVTHRSVAEQARITTSLSVYYFATLDDLLVAALTNVADGYTAEVRRIIDEGDDKLLGLAELIVACATTGHERAIAERELSTLASRRPALAPVARRWREDVLELARYVTDDPDAADALAVASDGLCTAILLDNARAELGYVYGVLAAAAGLSQRRPAR